MTKITRLTGIIIATLFISIILQTAHIRENILDTYKKAVQFYIPTISNNKKKNQTLNNNNFDIKTVTTNQNVCEFDIGAKSWYEAQLSYNIVNKRTGNCHKYFDAVSKLIHNSSSSSFKKSSIGNQSDDDIALAFTFLVHQQVGLFELLLYLIFRPQNAYCISVGKNTLEEVKDSVERLVECYNENFPSSEIFLIKNPNTIKWGDYSILDAELQCFKALLNLKHSWKFVLNLAGSELPFYSVEELSRRLRRSNIKYSALSYYNRNYNDRIKFRWKYEKMVNNEAEFKKLGPKEPPPFGLKIFKGYKNVILRRDMVNFFINHPISKTFLQYVQDIKIPDEHFYATLVRIENVVLTNMTYRIRQSHTKKIPMVRGLCSRYSLWRAEKCHGQLIRSNCNLAQEDLKYIYKENMMKNGKPDCFIANKFNIDVDAKAIICVVRRLDKKLSFM